MGPTREQRSGWGAPISAIKPQLPIASTGVGFLCIEVEQRHTLTTIVPDHQAITTLSAHFELVGFYVFARKARGEVVEARMFAPHYGIPEESATGMAAGALALLLHQAEGIRNLIIEQGHLMQPPSPALLMTEIDAKSRVLVSGAVIEA